MSYFKGRIILVSCLCVIFFPCIMSIDAGKNAYTISKKACPPDDRNLFLQLNGPSVDQCVFECSVRPHCLALVSKNRNICFLHNGTYELSSADKSCVYIEKTDIADLSGKCEPPCLKLQVCNVKTKICSFKECPRILSKNIENGVLYGNMNVIGSKTKIVCDNGYREIKNVKIITCISTGQWDHWPKCIGQSQTDCGEPQIIDNASVTAGTTVDGSVRTYTCSTSFGPTVDDTTITCTERYWSSPLFMCSPVCDNPPTVINATIQQGDSTIQQGDTTIQQGDTTIQQGDATFQPGSNLEGSVIYYTCNEGFASTTLNTSITCLKNRRWTEPQFACQPGCAEPDPIPNMKLKDGLSLIGSTREYVCAEGYVYTAASTMETIYCDFIESTQMWSPLSSNMYCVKDCGEPSSRVENAFVESGNTYEGSVRQYTCFQSFGAKDADDDTTTTCTEGIWSSPSLTCSPGCSEPQTFPELELQPGLTVIGQYRYYTCAPGFAIDPTYTDGTNYTIECGSNQEWTDIADSTTMCLRDCGDTPDVNNTVKAPLNLATTENAEVTYICDENYVPSQVKNTITCDPDDGIWKPNVTLTCEFADTLGKNCYSNNDCDESNSRCVDKICFCNPMYRYNNETHNCVKQCESIASDRFVIEHDKFYSLCKEGPTSSSVDECKKHCMKDSCLAFVWDFVDIKCYLLEVTLANIREAVPQFIESNPKTKIHTKVCDDVISGDSGISTLGL